MNKRKYKIGTPVIVRATTESEYQGPKTRGTKKILVSTKLSEPKIGQVVGLCHVQTGEYDWTTISNDEDGYYPDEPYLNTKETHSLWLVRFGMYNHPVKVQDKDLTLTGMGEKIPKFPLLSVNQAEWTPAYRQMLSEEAKSMPRNSLGRFTKEK